MNSASAYLLVVLAFLIAFHRGDDWKRGKMTIALAIIAAIVVIQVSLILGLSSAAVAQ